MISLTGFGVKLSQLILVLAGTSLALALIACMVTALILGMGMTTTAAYVIAASVLVPAMKGLGMPLLAAHLFIFYYAIKSGLTPPFCIAVFTASAISGGNWLQTAWYAIRLGIGGYIIPFYFLFQPALLMNAPPLDIIRVLISAMIAMFVIEACVMGYFRKPATVIERILYGASGLFLLHPGFYTDVIGIALVAIGILCESYLPYIPIIGKRTPVVHQPVSVSENQ